MAVAPSMMIETLRLFSSLSNLPIPLFLPGLFPRLSFRSPLHFCLEVSIFLVMFPCNLFSCISLRVVFAGPRASPPRTFLLLMSGGLFWFASFSAFLLRPLFFFKPRFFSLFDDLGTLAFQGLLSKVLASLIFPPDFQLPML